MADGRDRRQGRIEVIQRSIDQHLGQHGQLLNRQCHVAMRAFELVGQVGGHDVHGGQGFTGVTEQGGGVDAGEDGENMADGIGLFRVAQAGADGALGGFGELGQVEGFGF